MNAIQKSEAIKASLRKAFRTAAPKWQSANAMGTRLVPLGSWR